MKDLIAAVAFLIALIIFFSCLGFYPIEAPMPNGFGAKHKGDSGLIIPGKGDALAKTIIEPESIPERSEDGRTAEEVVDSKIEITTEATEETSEETSEEIKGENKMDGGMLMVFWHGVAAVLIGNASALLVAFAWTQIRGGKDE